MVTAPGKAQYEIMGVPLRLICKEAWLRELADDCLLPCRRYLAPELTLRVDWRLAEAATSGETTFRERDGRFEIRTPVGSGYADQTSGAAGATVTGGQDRGREIQAALIETLAVYLAYGRRPIALHAAATAHNGRCVLLTGSDGAGKSSLAYACLKTGMQIVADDVMYLAPGATVAWGHPIALHLVPGSETLFPEVGRAERVMRLNGECKYRIPVRDWFPGAAIACGDVSAVLALRRTAGSPRIVKGDRERVIRSLTGFKGDPPLDREANLEMARRLTAGPIALLETGADPEAAARLLKRWMEELAPPCA